MNQKIQCLIDGGFISIQDVLEYAQMYTDAMDIYDDEQIDKYGSELDYGMTEEDRMEMLNDIYQDDLIEPTLADFRSSEPEYVVASTAYYMEETYVFEANENGEITNFGEYGGIALRFNDIDWTNKALAVERTFGEGKYEFVREIDRVAKADHHLFKRIDDDDNVQLSSDTWDGGISDEK